MKTRYPISKGDKFGQLEAVRYVGKIRGHYFWECRCECGRLIITRAYCLYQGETKSCGHLRGEQHGLTRNRQLNSRREYSTWVGMKRRCLAPTCKEFPRYGGRGIRICDRWLNSFSNFMADMGPLPEGCSIDRIDNNGNYEPSNCRWATPKEQADNKSSNVYITIGSTTMNVNQWAQITGLNNQTLHSRIRRGWSGLSLIRPPRQYRAAL